MKSPFANCGNLIEVGKFISPITLNNAMHPQFLFGKEILNEFKKVSALDFNVFNVRDLTLGNELLTTIL